MLKKTAPYLSPILLLYLSIQSCTPVNFDNLPANDTVSYFYELPAFDTIQVSGFFHVELTESSTYGFKLKIPRKQLANFSFEQKESTLFFYKKTFGSSLSHNSDSAHLQILAPDYHYIAFLGPSFVYSSDTLHYDILNIYFKNRTGSLDLKVNNRYTRCDVNTATGNYNIAGQAKQLILYNGRLSNIFAQKTNTHFIRAQNHALGNIYCQIQDSGHFEFDILNKGDIYLKGHPKTIDTIAFRVGLGKLILE